MPTEEVDGLARQPRRRMEDGLEIDGVGHHEDGEDAERKAEITNAVDDESLDRRGVRRRFLVPEADQKIACETYALPAEEQLNEIVRCHQHQHGKGEQREITEEAWP